MDVFQLYKPIRNRVARLSYKDAAYVTWACTQYRQLNSFEIPQDIEITAELLDKYMLYEWDFGLLFKETLLNGSIRAESGQSLCDSGVSLDILGRLRKLGGDIYDLHGSKDNVLLELYRIGHRQFHLQSNPPNGISAIRHFQIFRHAKINELCKSELGLSVEEIFQCGMSLIGHFLSSAALSLPVQSSIVSLPPERFDKFLEFTARSVRELKELLKEEQQYNDEFVYAFNSLWSFPLIKMTVEGDEFLVAPMPTLLFWRMTNGLYYELVGKPGFSEAFGSSFESYVGEVLKRGCRKDGFTILPEAPYGARLGKKSTDWILSDGSAALFLECKVKRLRRDSKSAVGEGSSLEDDLAILAKAIVQSYKTIQDYQDNKYPHFPYQSDLKIFPVIVTLENWILFGPSIEETMSVAVQTELAAAGISPDILSKMPYSIMAVEELEVAAQAIEVAGLYEFMIGKLERGGFSQWTWLPYIKEQYPKTYPPRKLFSAEYEEIFDSIAEV